MTRLSHNMRSGLEDLLGDLGRARGMGDLGRLLLLSYYEVRRWARMAGEPELAAHAALLVGDCPHTDRAAFLCQVDGLIAELKQRLVQERLDAGEPAEAALRMPPARLEPASVRPRVR